MVVVVGGVGGVLIFLQHYHSTFQRKDELHSNPIFTVTHSLDACVMEKVLHKRLCGLL